MRKNIVRPAVERCEPRNLLSTPTVVAQMPPLLAPSIAPYPSLPPLVPDGSRPDVVPIDYTNPDPNTYWKWEASPAPSIYQVPDGLATPPNPVFKDGKLPLPGTPMQDLGVTAPRTSAATTSPTGADAPLPTLPSPDILAAPPEIDILDPYNPSNDTLHPVREPDILVPPQDGVIHPVPSEPPSNVIDPLDPANPPNTGLIDA